MPLALKSVGMDSITASFNAMMAILSMEMDAALYARLKQVGIALLAINTQQVSVGTFRTQYHQSLW
jgi:hypothetical protein